MKNINNNNYINIMYSCNKEVLKVLFTTPLVVHLASSAKKVHLFDFFFISTTC